MSFQEKLQILYLHNKSSGSFIPSQCYTIQLYNNNIMLPDLIIMLFFVFKVLLKLTSKHDIKTVRKIAKAYTKL